MYVCPIPKFVGRGTVDIVSPIFKIVGEGHVTLSPPPPPPPGFAPMHVYVITQYYIYFFFVWPLWVFVNSVCHTFFLFSYFFFSQKLFIAITVQLLVNGLILLIHKKKKWLNFIDSIKKMA